MPFRTRDTLLSIVVVLSLLAAHPRDSSAQLAEHAHIAPGATVRVRTRSGAERTWLFERASADELTLRRSCLGCRKELSLPWSDVARVDTLVVGGHKTRNVLVGSAVGGFLSAMVVAYGASTPCHWDGGSCPGFGFIIAAPAIIGTGMALGGIVAYHRQRFWAAAWQAH